jgi:hypothetical protein
MVSCWNVEGKGNGSIIYTVNLPTGVVNRHSVVVASICELSQPSGEALDYPFIGAAPMVVQNIAPQDNNTVMLRINIDWGSPLNYKINLMIC